MSPYTAVAEHLRGSTAAPATDHTRHATQSKTRPPHPPRVCLRHGVLCPPAPSKSAWWDAHLSSGDSDARGSAGRACRLPALAVAPEQAIARTWYETPG